MIAFLQYPPQSVCPFAENKLQLLFQTLRCYNANMRPQRPSLLHKQATTRGDEDKVSFFPRSQNSSTAELASNELCQNSPQL